MADHYDVTVNKKDLDVSSFAGELNKRWSQGWSLHSAFEQNGNTISIWERNDD
jgi:hypothetical protein